jgi:hypothetical protein
MISTVRICKGEYATTANQISSALKKSVKSLLKIGVITENKKV